MSLQGSKMYSLKDKITDKAEAEAVLETKTKKRKVAQLGGNKSELKKKGKK